MMRKVLLYKFLTIVLFLCFGPGLFGQGSAENIIKESFALSPRGEVMLENKYGKIEINGWNTDSVKMIVRIQVRAKSSEDARELMNRIVPNTQRAGDYLEIKTELRPKKKNAINKFFRDINIFDLDKTGIDIDYTVWVPNSVELNVTNKYGDIFVSDFTGILSVHVGFPFLGHFKSGVI